MAKSIEAALDFLPSVKPGHGGNKVVGMLKTLGEAFAEAREAEQIYRQLRAHGVAPGESARRAMAPVAKH